MGVRLYEDRRHRLGGRDTDMKPKDIMKGRYQRIQVEENEQEQVVPLEEALLVNDAKSTSFSDAGHPSQESE